MRQRNGKKVSTFIQYKAGFKYQLDSDFQSDLSFGPRKRIETFYSTFDMDGHLLIRKGYAWDGPSGPTIDTANFMRGSLVHDVLYWFIRRGDLGHSYRLNADDELRRICLADGMSKLRAGWVYWALRRAGRKAALPSSTKRIMRAP